MIEIKENILLANYATFKIGGEARYFCEAKNIDEIKEAVLWAREKRVPFFIFGGGSHLLVSDDGFDGLVIRVQSSKFKVQSLDSKLRIEAEAGVLLAKLVVESANNGMAGLGWAVGIPGTIGGAVFGNAGAYGHSISEIVDKVVALDPETTQIKEYSHQDCGFVYRGSNFKKNQDIILEVHLNFKSGDKEQLNKEIKDIIKTRARKIPPYASAGCIFKNFKVKDLTQVDGRIYTDSADKKTEIPPEKIRSGKIAVGYLIEQCGLKGKQVGQAKIHEGNAGFIINLGGARAADVLALINLCKEKVKEKYNLELEEEIRYLGL